jgi:hypothetical protein
MVRGGGDKSRRARPLPFGKEAAVSVCVCVCVRRGADSKHDTGAPTRLQRRGWEERERSRGARERKRARTHVVGFGTPRSVFVTVGWRRGTARALVLGARAGGGPRENHRREERRGTHKGGRLKGVAAGQGTSVEKKHAKNDFVFGTSWVVVGKLGVIVSKVSRALPAYRRLVCVFVCVSTFQKDVCVRACVKGKGAHGMPLARG